LNLLYKRKGRFSILQFNWFIIKNLHISTIFLSSWTYFRIRKTVSGKFFFGNKKVGSRDSGEKRGWDKSIL